MLKKENSVQNRNQAWGFPEQTKPLKPLQSSHFPSCSVPTKLFLSTVYWAGGFNFAVSGLLTMLGSCRACVPRLITKSCPFSWDTFSPFSFSLMLRGHYPNAGFHSWNWKINSLPEFNTPSQQCTTWEHVLVIMFLLSWPSLIPNDFTVSNFPSPLAGCPSYVGSIVFDFFLVTLIQGSSFSVPQRHQDDLFLSNSPHLLLFFSNTLPFHGSSEIFRTLQGSASAVYVPPDSSIST